MTQLHIVPADSGACFEDVIQVFGTKGDASRCFCQFFCQPAGQFRSSRRRNIELLQDQVERQTPGLLAYRDDRPVGWVQTGPIERYPRFTASMRYGQAVPAPPPDTWAITCFVVTVDSRHTGVAGSLVDAAVQLARRQGAAAIDAHPVDVRVRKSRPSGSELYVGLASLFTRRGFRTIARTSPARPVVRRRLTKSGARSSD